MGGADATSSDILGIEVGRSAIRGVLLNQRTTELTAAAEHPIQGTCITSEGVVDPAVAGPALEDLLAELGITNRSMVRVGLSIGPRNSGVGSGPSMAAWLEAQAVALEEPFLCAGGLGIAFVPSRAADAAVKLALGAGLDLVRIDLAPVAAARAIGDQVGAVICIGSGHGWQARMRDFEVLEAMENREIGHDDPLTLVSADGRASSIDRYGWVEIAEELDRSRRLDIGQLATAVGAAIGVAYESPANLMGGKLIGSGIVGSGQQLDLQHLAGYELSGDGAEATIRLQSKEPAGPAGVEDQAGGEDRHDTGRRQPRLSPRTALSPLARATEEPQQPWADTVDESDPITMFSPDTEVHHMLGKRERRLGPDIFLGLLVLTAVILLLAYLFL